MDELAAQFEPFAAKVGQAMPNEISTAVVAQISLAISAKRIADRLEAITTIIDGGGGERDYGQLNVGAEGNINVAING